MTHTLRVALILILLAGCSSGCGGKRKEQAPTQIQPPPREQPETGEWGGLPKQKK
jgi:hypothetical protein